MHFAFTFLIAFLIIQQVEMSDGSYHVRKLHAGVDCPCSEPSYCERITVPDRKEVIGYTVDLTYYQQFDWSKLTTVILYESELQKHGMDMICFAHMHQVRVLIATAISATDLVNATSRAAVIDRFFNLAEKYFMDGANIDVELQTTSKALRDGLTQYVKETKAKYAAVYPHSMVVVDVWWLPNIYHDVWGLAKYSDILFIMAYDEHNQQTLPCVAGANAPYYQTELGITIFRALGIPGHKLVLGLPWYGYQYNCTELVGNTCHKKRMGTHCSDKEEFEIDYSVVRNMLPHSMGGKQWGELSKSPFMNYKNASGATFQIWFDDAKSLSLKYELAAKFELRGVGVWIIDALNYANVSDPTTKEMWDAVPSYR